MDQPSATLHWLQAPPPPVGAYWLGGCGIGLGIHLSRRPRWLHRIMMRWAFGWEWRDAE